MIFQTMITTNSIVLLVLIVFCEFGIVKSVVRRVNPIPTSATTVPKSIDLSIPNSLPSRYISTSSEVKLSTLRGIHFHDITESIREVIKQSNVMTGTATVLTRHTTTAITINEMEGRLIDDARQFLLKLVPPMYPYLHNDIHLRSGPPGWPGGDEAWRAQEPINAHSHLISMLIGTDVNVPIKDGKLMIGQWQSIIFVELDGPRTRSVALNIQGSSSA